MTVRRVSLPRIPDSRGSLMVAEQGPHIPFAVKRIFTIYDVPPQTARGAHAHRAQEQFLVMLAGGCVAVADDGAESRTESLIGPHQGLYVPPMVWLELQDFQPQSICLVLSSGLYDEADYIRNYAEFTALVGGRG